jgi:hypothetical protein
MTTYTKSHKEYYEKNKDRIFRKTHEYRRLYNKKYYKKNKEEIKAKRKQHLEDVLYAKKHLISDVLEKPKEIQVHIKST